MRMWLVSFLLIWGGGFSSAIAHEVRPGYLQITEVEPALYDVLWKTPAQGDMRLALNVIMPPPCHAVARPRVTHVKAAVIQRWRSACANSLAGETITIEKLETTLTDVIFRFEPLAGSVKTLRLSGAAPSVVIPERQSFWSMAETYARLGVEHILLGFDHLLFVLCLLLLVRNLKRLIGAVTAFTIAHSITLAGTSFGWFSLAIAPVEAVIALSIMFLAAEIIRAREGNPGAAQRWPWIAAFAFGLLHGFGFAAALREIGLPESAAPLALLFFNLGVEAGQIIFVALFLSALFVRKRYGPALPAWSWRTAPYFAGAAAAFWFIERTVNMVL